MPAQYSQFFIIAAMVGVFWFLVLRPQQTRAKQHREMLSALSAGDEIVTYSGIFATVIEVGERLCVRVLDGTELEIAPGAVNQVITAAAAEKDAAQEAEADDSADSDETGEIEA